jgi:CCR4-NOT transcription complex subunit 6
MVECTLCSWNVLAEGFVKQSTFPYCGPAHLAWEHRRELLPRILGAIAADVVCLQEVDRPDFFGELFEQMGYTWVFAKRPEGLDGCLMAFRSDKFELVRIPPLRRTLKSNQCTHNSSPHFIIGIRLAHGGSLR